MEGHEYLCTACGSTDILKNSLAEWDRAKQEWIDDGSGYLICSNCGSEDVKVKNIHEEVDISRPIVQYGIHVIDVFYPSTFLNKEFGINSTGLTIIFERDTMNLIKVLGELEEREKLKKLIVHAETMLKGYA